MRTRFFIALVGVGLALLAGSGIAQADHDVSFGIRPTKAFEDRPETFSYFSHELAPGAVLTDEALVINDGDVPLTLKLYAADGITAQNTGTALANEGQESTGASRGVSRWLSLSVTEIPLQPGEEMAVPFTINVPSDASPGHHVGGLIVETLSNEEASPSGEGETQFGVKVVRRVGVAVVIDVPGPHVAGLEITGASLRQQDDAGATFVIGVHNTGNIFVKGEGSLLLMDCSGEELASVPLTMDTVLPGDATTFQVTHPIRLADGCYLVTVALDYEGETAVVEGVEVKVKDGQPEGEPDEGTLPPRVTDIIPTPAEEGGPPIGRYAAYGAPFIALALAALAFILWRRARRRRAKPDEPAPPPTLSPSGLGGRSLQEMAQRAGGKMNRPKMALIAIAAIVVALALGAGILAWSNSPPASDSGGNGDNVILQPSPNPTLTPTPEATPTATPEAPPIAGVTPVAEFEVTVISAEVPANVRQAPTTESGLVGVIPLGIKATVVGEVVGVEAFAGSGISTWYLVKAIPPDLPEDGFVYSSVVVVEGDAQQLLLRRAGGRRAGQL